MGINQHQNQHQHQHQHRNVYFNGFEDHHYMNFNDNSAANYRIFEEIEAMISRLTPYEVEERLRQLSDSGHRGMCTLLCTT